MLKLINFIVFRTVTVDVNGEETRLDLIGRQNSLKVHKIEIIFGFDFEICIISLIVMSKY